MIIEFIDGKAQVKDIPITLSDMHKMPIVNGQAIFCEDVRKMYVDGNGNRVQISHEIDKDYYLERKAFEQLELINKQQGGNYYEKK